MLLKKKILKKKTIDFNRLNERETKQTYTIQKCIELCIKYASNMLLI